MNFFFLFLNDFCFSSQGTVFYFFGSNWVCHGGSMEYQFSFVKKFALIIYLPTIYPMEFRFISWFYLLTGRLLLIDFLSIVEMSLKYRIEFFNGFFLFIGVVYCYFSTFISNYHYWKDAFMVTGFLSNEMNISSCKKGTDWDGIFVFKV